ncbi:ATP-grasp domain-containing protein [Streptomyces sp. NRRL F-2747]|uniref:ATP-grasp domain-containing protein n=1 Tax=Streptomyces sp. NRRL F-2747 TaxID=1463843 RepID=UPI000A7F9CF9|nr:ATP-grasp domain-containing protein [Streptomyces sp. NRRL F-2747]
MSGSAGRIAIIGGLIEPLRAAHDLGLEVVLIHNPGGVPSGAEDYCAEILEVDFKNEYDTVERLIVGRHRQSPFRRVFSLTENGLLPAVRINELLGLGGNSIASVQLLKDKAAMRRHLAGTELDTVRHQTVYSAADLDEFRSSIGGPVFVKPTDSAGSIGVFRVDDAEDAKEGWRRLTATGRDEALAEEYLQGPEFSVEGFCADGRHQVITITNTLLHPAYYELGHSMPAALAPDAADAIHRTVQRLIEAVGLTEGPTHTEVRLTPRGPRVIESHNRIGGERIHELMEMAFGIDVPRMSIAVPLGLEPMPDLTDLGTRGAAMRHILPEPGRVLTVSGVTAVPADDPDLRLRIGLGAGDDVAAVVDGVSRDKVACYVLAAGEDVTTAERRCAEVLDTVRITTAPPEQKLDHTGRAAGSGTMDKTDFIFREYAHFDPGAVVDVLRGHVLGVVFRGMIPAAECTRITERFWSSPARRTRGADAPGQYVGSYHYHKTTRDYLDEANAAQPGLDEILGTPHDPLTTIRSGLADALAAEGVRFRSARHDGHEAGTALLRSWHGAGQFALAPHEDEAQCGEPRQADFEIQRVKGRPIGAMNLCLENGSAGRLVVWNTRPDDAVREELGLVHTGSPYPLRHLDGIESLRLDIAPGDVYFFNGAHVHAVEPETDPAVRRTTLSGILGFIDDRTVVSWT